MKKKTNIFITIWGALKGSFELFKKHDTVTLGAALSYYTAFSLPPIIIIIISITGAILGPEAVHGEIKRQLQSLLGSGTAEEIQNIVKAAYSPGKNWITTIIAIAILLIGATSVFGQLRTSLNTIWDIKAAAKQPVVKFLLNRLFSFAMIVCMAFLLLVSLAIHTGLAAFTDYLNERFSGISVILLKVIDYCLSFGLTTVLFLLIYKFMSDAKIRWRRVLPGAFFTALLFILGKYLIGLYLGNSNLSDTYGAAGSIVVLLTWVFYSSQILFFGAEFTRVWAVQHGASLDRLSVETEKDEVIKRKVATGTSS